MAPVGRIDVQVDLAGHRHVAAGSQESWIRKHQFWRQTVSEKLLGSV
jgi:hypothetical protein